MALEATRGAYPGLGHADSELKRSSERDRVILDPGGSADSGLASSGNGVGQLIPHPSLPCRVFRVRVLQVEFRAWGGHEPAIPFPAGSARRPPTGEVHGAESLPHSVEVRQHRLGNSWLPDEVHGGDVDTRVAGGVLGKALEELPRRPGEGG